MALLRAILLRLLGPFSLVLMLLATSYFRSDSTAGSLITAISIVLAACVIAKFGFEQLIYQDLHEATCSERPGSETIAAALMVALPVSAVFAWILLAFFVAYSGGSDGVGGMTGWQAVLSASATSYCQITAAKLQAKGRTAASITVFPVVLYSTTGALVCFEMGIGLAIFLGAAASVLVVLALDAYTTKLAPIASVSKLLGRGKYFAINNISSLSFNWLVNVYLGLLLSPREVLVFALASRLAALFGLPLSAATPFIQSKIARENAVNNSEGVARFSARILLLVVAMQCLIVIAVIGAYHTLGLDNDPRVSEAGFVFAALLVAQIFNTLSGPSGSVLAMTGHMRSVAILNVFVSVAGLVAGLLSATFFDVRAVALTLAICTIVQNIGYVVLLKMNRGTILLVDALALLFKRKT